MLKTSPKPKTLEVQIGQYSTAGVKSVNQDYCAAKRPDARALTLKGTALAVGDGVSSSAQSGSASKAAVTTFLKEYYLSSDAWSVETAGSHVLSSINSNLFDANRQNLTDTPDQGLVCTFAALVLKGCTGHLFHVGDSRIYLLRGGVLRALTEDHLNHLGDGPPSLGRALGAFPMVNSDYNKVRLEEGDVFLLTTDGVHEHWSEDETISALGAHSDLDIAAKKITKTALDAGSEDNLTVMTARVDTLPDEVSFEAFDTNTKLPALKHQAVGAMVDDLQIVRSIHSNNRSHIYLAHDPDGGRVALKVPATGTLCDPAYMRRFLMEEWIARRLNSPHVLKAAKAPDARSSLYIVTEFIDGQTLRQWMADNTEPPLQQVRNFAGQMIKGLRAFHRKDMLHQDFRPENVMIDEQGTVKIIDFGSTRVAGVQEALRNPETDILGTLQYSAPEYLIGENTSSASDQFSLGVVIYEMLTGQLPYGAHGARVQSRRDVARLVYRPANFGMKNVPDWIDVALRKATHPDPNKRFSALSEFEAALKSPLTHGPLRNPRPLIEQNPLRFWQALCAILATLLMISLFL